MDKCADCGVTLNPFARHITRAESKEYGVFYEGPPICSNCEDDRYRELVDFNKLKEGPEAEKVSNCCGSSMIPPDLLQAEEMGSLWRAYACYICKKCGCPCEPVDRKPSWWQRFLNWFYKGAI